MYPPQIPGKADGGRGDPSHQRDVLVPVPLVDQLETRFPIADRLAPISLVDTIGYR